MAASVLASDNYVQGRERGKAVVGSCCHCQQLKPQIKHMVGKERGKGAGERETRNEYIT